MPFMKPRIPVSPSASARRLDLSFLKLVTFWMLQAGNIIQSFGYFLPSTYLPSYSTTTVGLSQTTGTMLVSLFNATAVFGGIALGALCDRFAVTNIMLLSSVGSALSVLLFWGLASSSDPGSSRAAVALLTLFSISYGFFAGGFSSTWSGIITQIKSDSSSSLETGLVFGLLAGGRGIGNVISGPLSTVLLRQGSLSVSHGHNSGTGYGTEYGTLILFTGITAFFGAWSWMWRYISSALRFDLNAEATAPIDSQFLASHLSPGPLPILIIMAAVDPTIQDPLLSLRRAIASGNLPTPTTSSELTDQPATDDLAQATHLYFPQPTPQVIPLTTPTRFVSASTESAVDLRSIFFAWQKKDVAIPEYIASAQELNEALKKKGPQEAGREEQVQNLVFVERLDLITWLEGASDESEYIKPLEGAAAAAEAAAAAAGAAQADASAGIASGATGGISSVPSGAPGAAQAGAQAGRAQKPIDPRLQEIYNGERKTGDRNTVLRGIKPTDFSHVRKSAELFLDRNRTRPGQPSARPGSKTQGAVPAPSAGLPMPSSRKSSSRLEPIILLSPSASSLIRMSNVKSFLEDGVFVPPDHPTLSMSTEANLVTLSRPLRIKADPSNPTENAIGSGNRSIKPTRFILVDGTTNFKPEYWQRIVAVFTTGQTWQFKSYKWSSPPELFKHATGIYVGWRGELPPPQVTSWGRGVQSFAVERWDERNGTNGLGRWRDREVVEGIWTVIEEGMRLRGWGSK
ncbi:general substrate transporter [Penicillium alfredii]|uniref:General substrate transporter n=1 Tax=Penicillium alfredii TaxID=1506179 RepID=A0A9W9FSM1_9EURO|nr:general substrate transporter [Penicillium alfredii]KAJ5105589.1 general substrate transporter [Penicillium alfredii]